MRVYQAHSEDGEPSDIVDVLIACIEQETKKEVSHVNVLNEKEDGPDIKALIYFADESILNAVIFIQMIEGKMACRIKGNYIEI